MEISVLEIKAALDLQIKCSDGSCEGKSSFCKSYSACSEDTPYLCPMKPIRQQGLNVKQIVK